MKEDLGIILMFCIVLCIMYITEPKEIENNDIHIKYAKEEVEHNNIKKEIENNDIHIKDGNKVIIHLCDKDRGLDPLRVNKYTSNIGESIYVYRVSCTKV